MKTRTPQRERFLLDVLTIAVENGGYGFFYVDEGAWDEVSPREAYAVIVDKDDQTRRWRIDIDTMAQGLAVIRGAHQATVDGERTLVNAAGQRLHFGGEARRQLVAADRTNFEDGDIDAIGGLAVLECALFGRVVYA